LNPKYLFPILAITSSLFLIPPSIMIHNNIVNIVYRCLEIREFQIQGVVGDLFSSPVVLNSEFANFETPCIIILLKINYARHRNFHFCRAVLSAHFFLFFKRFVFFCLLFLYLLPSFFLFIYLSISIPLLLSIILQFVFEN
jgi:hypothetical protein